MSNGTTAARASAESEAAEAVEKDLSRWGNADLELAEVMEFDNHLYAEVEEKAPASTHSRLWSIDIPARSSPSLVRI